LEFAWFDGQHLWPPLSRRPLTPATSAATGAILADGQQASASNLCWRFSVPALRFFMHGPVKQLVGFHATGNADQH